jgi:hypothetical protein
MSSLFYKKQEINMKQEFENQQDTDSHLLDKLSIGAVSIRLNVKKLDIFIPDNV